MRFLSLVAFGTALIILPGSGFAQNTIFVPTAQHPSIQSAVNVAQNGDLVVVSPGTYFENIDFIGKAITVMGFGPGVSIIDGAGSGSVVSFQTNEGPNSILEGFTIQNGSGTPVLLNVGVGPDRIGGGIFVFGSFFSPPTFGTVVISPTIRNCQITGNAAARGAGVSVFGFAEVSLEDCVIENNSAVVTLTPTTLGGGVHGDQHCKAVIERCIVRQNSAKDLANNRLTLRPLWAKASSSTRAGCRAAAG